MTFNKQPPFDNPTPADAPPSYGDTLESAAGPQSQLERTPLIGRAGPSIPGTSSRHSPHPAPPLPLQRSPLSSSSSTYPSSHKSKAKATSWFNFCESPESRTAREVRSTVRLLIRDLIQEHSSPREVTGILQSCAEACAAYSISLSSILHEKSIVGHTPLYWVIVKRLPDQHQTVPTLGPDLLSALLSYMTPLNQDTIKELRLVCLATSDQALFQWLRLSPEFAPVSGSDQMLFGVTVLADEISVQESSPPGGANAFAVDIVIPHFHKRMAVSKSISLEFIARAQMWRLSFFVAPEHTIFQDSSDPPSGSWCISLSLLENSLPTYIDSKVFFKTPQPPHPDRNSIKINSKEKLGEEQGCFHGRREIVVSLEGCVVGPNLRYGNSQAYIGADEKLRVRFDAKLQKPA